LLQGQRQRWQEGDRVLVETYLHEHPSLREKTDELLELLYHEIVLREERGQSPSVEEYQRRFPEYAEEIRLYFEVHAALCPPGGPTAGGPPAAGGLPSVRGYEVLEVLGRGGMGVVYKARQTALNRLVALKMMGAETRAGEEGRNRFLREAQAVARLKHAHIVQIHEVGEQDGSLFLSLEYVDGGPLARHLDGRPQPALPAARLVETLARAIHYAHQQGIVHRDLKPANILLQEDLTQRRQDAKEEQGPSTEAEYQGAGAVPSSSSALCVLASLREVLPKITDFGLAKLREDSGGLTRTGDLLGTPCYMAPEQVDGPPARVGPATDVYGLGAILYELLTGRPPFRGETSLATCQQIRSTEPVPPSRLQPACPRDVETICLKCLQKEPSRRYASALALANDLRRFREGRPIKARPVTVWGRAVKWARRRPAVAALLAGIVTVTLLGLALTSWKWRQADRQRQLAQARQAEAVARSYCDRIARACQELEACNVARANQLLDECRRETPELCHWEWDFLKRRSNEHLLELKEHMLDVRCVSYSPNGRLLASCSGEWNGTEPGEVLVWDAVRGKRLYSFKGHRAPVFVVAFHPAGRRLASAGWDGVILLWDLDHPGAEPAKLNLGLTVPSVAFSPGGERLAAACKDGRVRVFDGATGRLLQVWPLHKGPASAKGSCVFSVAYSPDGRYLASAGKDGMVCLVKAESGQVVRRYRHGIDARQVAFSPDGRWLVSGAWGGTLQWLDLTRPEAEPVLSHLYGAAFLGMAFSPDGRRLACSTRRRGVVVLTAGSARQEWALREDLGVLSLAFHPDGRCLATAGENLRIKVWDLTGRDEPRRFHGHEGAVYSLAVSPDGQRVALAGAYNTGFGRPAKTLRLYNLAEERFLGEFAGHSDSLTGAAFRPDGREVATASADGTARLWDVPARPWPRPFSKPRHLLKHGGKVTGVAYSPSGESLATSCADGRLRLWDVAGGRPLRTFAGHAEGVNGVAFAPCGRYLASAGADRTVRVWEVATGRALGAYRNHDRAVGAVVFSRGPYGTRLASADVGQTVWLWRVSAAGELTPDKGPLRPDQPDRRAATQELAVLGGSRRAITSLAFSPDGRRLASVSPDRPVQLWDVATGREILALTDTPYRPACVAFAPDGRRLVLSTAEGWVAVWDSEFLEPSARARAAADLALGWHWEQAVRADRDKAPFAVIFHTDRGIAAGARELKWYVYRAWGHAELGHWGAARADYAWMVKQSPDACWIWYRYAIAHLGAGDAAGYHATCARMLHQFKGNPGVGLQCLYACLPDPKAAGDPVQLVALGEAAVKARAGADRWSRGIALRAYGAALYRARRYAEAVKALEEAGKYFPPRAWDRLFLAMARKHLSEHAKARNEFDKAVQQIAAAGDDRATDARWYHWLERVEVLALRREAETVLGGGK
jgi:WD40 repeat protein/serine/threonine protein kinase